MDEHEHRPRTRGKLRTEQLDALLFALDPDRAAAAKKYETARSGLIAIFLAGGFFTDAEDLADETLDRAARRTYEKAGTEDAVVNVIAYMRAVANRVATEFHRRPRLVPIDETVAAGTPQEENSGLDEDALDCLRGLIADLPSEDQKIIFDYYDYSKPEKISQRRSLAQETARSAGALRVKVCRIRKLLRKRLFQLLAQREHAKRIGGGR